MSFDVDEFEERAAIMEFDGGMTRFAAETQAARRQGVSRWQAMREVRDAKSLGNSDGEWNSSAKGKRDVSDNVPGMQRGASKRKGPMPERHRQA